jgi:dihydrofolate synthase/folylpolyglutamate synthase
VLTNVDLEHTALLGDNCEAIAREKLGILRPCRTLVTGISRHAPLAKVVSDVAKARGARVVHVEAAASESLHSTNVRIANAVLALLPCAPLGEQTIEDARLPGRQELVRLQRGTLDGPAIPVILDGAHVASSLSAVLRDCEMDRALRGPCTAVLGMGADKDMDGLLSALGHLRHQGVRVVATTSRQGGPTREAADIARAALRLGLPAVDFEDPVCALRHAIAGAAESQESGWILVTGSLYLVGAVRPHLFALCHRPPVAMPLAA